jgi:dienelactone hydrolase
MKSMVLPAFIMLLAAPAQAKLISQPVEYKFGDTQLEGYLAYDDTFKDKRPGVLVVHEWWGLNDYIKMRANRLAELGYVAFALDMYGKGIRTKDPEEAAKLSDHLKGKPLMRQRAQAGLEILRGNDRVDPTRIAAIGYCFGGTTVLELAYAGANIAGVVSFHGGLTVPAAEDLSRIKAGILVCHGADDGFVSAKTIAAFQDAMRKADADWQMIFYGGAVHGFTNPAAGKAGIPGVAYNKNADERSWKLMQVFFEEIFAK